MGRVFLAGHGLDPGGAQTFVPHGVTLHFHADVDTLSVTALSTAVLATGANRGSLQEYGPFAKLPNYFLSKFSDAEMAAKLTAVRREEELLLVGNEWFDPGRVQLPNPIRLCSGTCTGYRHNCKGVLGLLPQAGYDEIHILACRARFGDPQPQRTTHMAGEAQPGALFELVAQSIFELLKLAEADSVNGTRRAEEYFDQFKPEEQAILLHNPKAQNWSYNRHARDFLREHGDWTFYHFHAGQPAQERDYHLNDAELASAISRAREYYRHQLATAESEEERSAFKKTLSPGRE